MLPMVPQVQREKRVTRVLQEQLVPLVLQAHKVFEEKLVLKEKEGLRVLPEQPDLLVQLVLQVLRDLQDLLDYKVQLVLKVWQVQ